MILAGKIKEIIDSIILQRSKGNPAIAETTKAKFILKGINPNKFHNFSPDDPEIMEKVRNIAKQLKVNYLANNEINIKSVFSTKTLEKEVVSDIKNQLDGCGIKLLVFFASSCFDHSKLSHLLQEAFADCIVFGCSTAGEIVSGKLLKNSIVAMVFNSNIISDVKVEVIEQMKENLNIEAAFTSFERYFNESSYTMDATRYIGIVLIDGVSMKEEKLMDQIGNRTNVFFIGGSAGDDLKFAKTFVCANGKAYTDSAVLVLLKMNDHAEFGIIKSQSFKDLDHVLIANKVNEDTREVIEFNNRPAILAYADAVGAASIEEAPEYFMTNPVGLFVGKNEVFIRSPQQKKGTNIQFYCNLLEGMEVRLLESTNIIEDTKNALEEKIDEFGRIEGIINFHCIERTLELEKHNLVKQYGEIFSDIPTIGFSTYGEEYIGHINQTSVMLVFKNNLSNQRKVITSIETHQKLRFIERVNEKIIKENSDLQKEVLELNQQLEETTAALKEFNIMLEDEINERTKTEEALKLAGEQFSKVFHSTPHMMIIRRKSDNCCIDVNYQYLNATGYSRQEIIEKTPAKVGIDENDYERVINILKDQGRVDNFEFSRWTKQGMITAIMSAVEIEMNGEQCILFASNDITEMKHLNSKLRASEKKFRQLAETINEIFLITDKERVVYVSPAYEKISGMSCQSLLDNQGSLVKLIHPADRERMRNFILLGYQNMNETANEEFRIIRLDGEIRWLWLQSYPIRAEANNSPLKATCIVDITDRKKIEDKLREQEKKTQMELLLAARVQRDSLPLPFNGNKVRVSTIFKPHSTVSGDFFNYKWFEESKKLCGYIVDVSGHGMATALQTATFKMMLDNVLLNGEKIEEDTFQIINQRIMQYLYEGSFVALLYFEFDFRVAALKLISAGITLYLVANPQECSLEPISGCYLGIIDNPEIQMQIRPLKAGDIYFLMSDGASDLIESRGLNKKESIIGYMNWLGKLAESPDRNDDFTVVCIELLKETKETKETKEIQVLDIKNVGDIKRAQIMINEFLERNTPLYAAVLEIAINEAMNNGINACGQVCIRTRRVGGKLIIRVKDVGPGFNTKEINIRQKKDMIEEEFEQMLEAESGRGILLMKLFCDRVIYNDKGDEVLLMKQIS